jgi:membrane-bound serine protease (ClpP class)
MTSTLLTIVILFVAAAVLILLDLVTPTFGIIAGIGVVALIAAVWLSFTVSNWLGSAALLLAIFGAPAYTLWLMHVLPRSRLGKRIFLPEAGRADADALPEAGDVARLVGQAGVAETPLRPSGAVRVAGRRLTGIAESGFVEQGSAVTVVGVSGADLVVRAARADHETGSNKATNG